MGRFSSFFERKRDSLRSKKIEARISRTESSALFTKLAALAEKCFDGDKDMFSKPSDTKTVAQLRNIAASDSIPDEIRVFVSLYLRRARSQEISESCRSSSDSCEKQEGQLTVTETSNEHLGNSCNSEHLSTQVLTAERVQIEKPSQLEECHLKTVDSHPRAGNVSAFSLTQPRLQARINTWVKKHRMSTLNGVNVYPQTYRENAAESLTKLSRENSLLSGKSLTESLPLLETQSNESTCPSSCAASFTSSLAQDKFSRIEQLSTMLSPSSSLTKRSLTGSLSARQEKKLSSTYTIPQNEISMVPLAKNRYIGCLSLNSNSDGRNSFSQVPILRDKCKSTTKRTESLNSLSDQKVPNKFALPEIELLTANHYNDTSSMAGPYPMFIPSHRTSSS